MNVQREWSIDDLMDAHEALDFKAEAERSMTEGVNNSGS
jgi:hypothetical protein